MGAIPEITVVVAIALSHVCLFTRLIMFSRASGFSVQEFILGVYVNALKVAVCAAAIPLVLTFVLPVGFWWSVLHLGVSLIWTACVIFFIGCGKEDRAFLLEFIGRRAGK